MGLYLTRAREKAFLPVLLEEQWEENKGLVTLEAQANIILNESYKNSVEAFI